MGKKWEIFVLCFCLFVFSNCKKNIQKVYTDLDNETTIIALPIQTSFVDSTYFRNPQIVVLETIDESLLSGIRRIAFDDNRLFIFDSRQMKVFIFDINGKYLNKIDCIGRGPREYIHISDIAVDTNKKQIILLCITPTKCMYFTYNGTFIMEENLDDSYKQLAVSSDYIYFEKTSIPGQPKQQLLIVDKKTGTSRSVLPEIDIQNFLCLPGNSLSRGKDILYVRRFDNSIYELIDGKIIKKYNIDFNKYSFPDRLINESDAGKVLTECVNNKYVFSMANAISSDRYIMFDTNLGFFLYDKKDDLLTAYRLGLEYSKWNFDFQSFLPLENTNKIVCSIDNPSRLKSWFDSLSNEQKKDKRAEVVTTWISKLVDENNPVLFIYEFKE
jgi:hypothetical protein